MKQKIVIRVSMGDHKKGRSKALKITVSLSGVESAGLIGEGKDQIQVIGEGIDAVKLTRLLRKNVGPSEIMSVGPVEQKKPDDKPKDGDKSKDETNQMIMMPPYIYTSHYHPSVGYPVYDEPSCTIM